MHVALKIITASAIALGCVTLIWYVIPIAPKLQETSSLQITVEDPSVYLRNSSIKTILLWNDFFDYPHMGIDNGIGSKIFEDLKCPVTTCYIWDYADGKPEIPVEDFDLVWFHAMDIPKGTLLRNKPPKRKPHQRYFFYLLESPSTFQFDLEPLNGFFNWTGTYRRDSDIYRPYGTLTDKSTGLPYVTSERHPIWRPFPEAVTTRSNPASAAPQNMTSKKKKLAAWVVSNCVKIPSNRDMYVDDLLTYIDIDIYGACGTPCEGDCTSEALEKNYKFYLAFENSLCEDYVTEKFFRTLQMDIVPVVFGGADYTFSAPPMSYIDTKDFKKPIDLANYLLYLDSNPDEYEMFFWWKKYYTVNGTSVLCDMCEMLNDASRPDKVYDDLEGWWNKADVCANNSGADIRTWVKRLLKSPGQAIAHSFVLLISHTNYAVFLFVTISLIMVMYCLLVLLMKTCIRRIMRNSSEVRYMNVSKLL